MGKYGTNVQNFFPGYESKKDQEENEKNNPRISHPRGITRMQSDSGILLRQPPGKELNMDGKKVVTEGFIRPRAFSREENISPPSELSKLMTSMNSQYSARNINKQKLSRDQECNSRLIRTKIITTKCKNTNSYRSFTDSTKGACVSVIKVRSLHQGC